MRFIMPVIESVRTLIRHPRWRYFPWGRKISTVWFVFSALFAFLVVAIQHAQTPHGESSPLVETHGAPVHSADEPYGKDQIIVNTERLDEIERRQEIIEQWIKDHPFVGNMSAGAAVEIKVLAEKTDENRNLLYIVITLLAADFVHLNYIRRRVETVHGMVNGNTKQLIENLRTSRAEGRAEQRAEDEVDKA